MESQTGECGEVQERDEVHRGAVKAGALFQAAREKMREKFSLDFLSILGSVFDRKPSCKELSQLIYKSDPGPEELIRHFWGRSRVRSPFRRASPRKPPCPSPSASETPDRYLWSKTTDYGRE